jgi:hypothetical protein
MVANFQLSSWNKNDTEWVNVKMKWGFADGYDLGILIRLKRFGGFHDMDWINSELISEVGWLKDGEKELFIRLANLLEMGCIEMQMPQQDAVESRYYGSVPKFRFCRYPN